MLIIKFEIVANRYIRNTTDSGGLGGARELHLRCGYSIAGEQKKGQQRILLDKK